MKKILVIGAGRSAVTLIKYLLDNAEVNNWQVTVADFSVDLASSTEIMPSLFVSILAWLNLQDTLSFPDLFLQQGFP